jgi:hypothetical protein
MVLKILLTFTSTYEPEVELSSLPQIKKKRETQCERIDSACTCYITPIIKKLREAK